MKIFDVRDFGAVGDSKTLNTSAIQSAIDECAKVGGRVLVSEGVYMTGTIVLKDNIDLHVDRTATLLGSPDCADYPEFDKKYVNVEKLPRNRGAALIFAEECENISITGMGKIDANGYSFVEECKPYHWGWRYKRLDLPTPPRVVFFTGCKNILVEDITMINQPAGWSYWIHDCDFVSFDKVKILADAEFPNNDGIHINSSRNVTVSNSVISTGDDCIIVRANNVSLKENKVCEKVVITNCTLTSHTNAIRIGWLNDGIIRNCVFSNIAINETRTGIAIVLPSRPIDAPLSDEGREDTLIENLSFSNITMDSIYLRPVQIDVADSPVTRCAAIRDIRFDCINASGIGFPYIIGRENCHIKNIRFSNCDFRKLPPEKLSYFFDPTAAAVKDRGDNAHGAPSSEVLKESENLKIKFADNVTFDNTSFEYGN
jgi:polygalacturonase